ncbi:MAG: hypothetical protein MI700_11285, partial [Balneolales bacterium]|nr:hypothetical protein [Balneolales bacterium]
MKFAKYLLISCTYIFVAGACEEENTPDIFSLNISITPENSGTVIPSQELRVVAGEELQVLAMSEEGYGFLEWTGSISSTENPLSVVITQDLDLTANFLLKNYPLTTSVLGSGTITETIVNSKTDYDHGTIVQLQAVPDDGWTFVEWSGDTTGDDEIIQVTVTSALSITAIFEVDTVHPVPVEKTNNTKIYMHYMPWFQSGPYDGFWGTHWTMNNRNPENIADGQRDIASHFYPLIGPYSSRDPDVAEYHLLLMKYSGIDGILIDWYGTYDVNDYKLNLEGSENIISLVDEVGLTFGIVYEDRTTAAVVNAGEATTKIEAATQDFNYIN